MAEILFPTRMSWAVLAAIALGGACAKDEVKSIPEEKPDYAATPGLVEDYTSASGLMYAHTTQTVNASSGEISWKMNVFAAFSDPPSNICSAIDPVKNNRTVWVQSANLFTGEVKVNEFPLTWSVSGTYSCNPLTSHAPDTSLQWSMPGNAALPGFVEFISTPFARLRGKLPPVLWLSKGNNYRVEIAGYFANYDSLWLSVGQLGAVRVRPGTTYAQYSANAIQSHYSGYDSAKAEVKAMKYYHARHGGRNYQFLSVTTYTLPGLITNY
jgi:hypothetical protein